VLCLFTLPSLPGFVKADVLASMGDCNQAGPEGVYDCFGMTGIDCEGLCLCQSGVCIGFGEGRAQFDNLFGGSDGDSGPLAAAPSKKALLAAILGLAIAGRGDASSGFDGIDTCEPDFTPRSRPID
jgi:hypothetical protein